MTTFVLAFLIGVVAGLRAMTPPAAVSWAARLGWLHLENTWLAFLGYAATPYIFTLAAIGELINGAVAGAIGAVAGTLGGYELRARLVKATGGKDLPIALLEDAIAVGGAL